LIKAVVFDYGGTLVTSVKPWTEMKPRALRSTYRYLRRQGLEIPYDEYLSVNDKVFDTYAELETKRERDIPDRIKYLGLVERLFPGARKAKKVAMAAGASDSFWRVANGNFKLRDDAKACIDRLESMGLGLGMISNHHDSPSLMRSLRRYRIEPRFKPIIVSEKVNVRKPDSKIFNLCLSAMRVSPTEAMYVGDAPEIDVVGAKNAGMFMVLLGAPNPDGPKPDFTVKKLSAIPPLVADLNGDS
jgi:HAD superfamily hydrolase (TIGR01549 family)